MAKYKKVFKTQRQHRYEVLRVELFTRSEARTLSRFLFKFSYVEAIRQNRADTVNRAYTWAYTKRLRRADAIKYLKANIRRQYKRSGLKDIYAWIRTERDKALARGDYIPPVKKKRPRLYKGDVAQQRKRWQARQERKREGKVGVQFDSEGKVIGYVEFDPASGKFLPRYTK